jgi:hypothetical protein
MATSRPKNEIQIFPGRLGAFRLTGSRAPCIPRAGPTDPLRPRAEGTGVPAGGLSEELFVVDFHKKKGLVTVAIHVVGCEIR